MAKDNKDFFKQKNPWSEIKDRLLECYLPQYFQKVLKTYKPIFYVDCFAGKGRFDDGKDGSPRIAMKIRKECIDRSLVNNNSISTCLIDVNFAADLKTHISEFQSNGKIDVISGRYEEQIEKLLSGKQNTNVFLYIDPYGIKALDFGLFEKFATYNLKSIEMLINMNSFGFIREACRAMAVDFQIDETFDELVEYDPTEVDTTQQSKQILNGIAGGDYWQSIITDYKEKKINGYQAEQRFSQEYKQSLRKKYKYILDMPIRLKSNQRPKYRMIHITNHEEGCLLMADNMSSRSEELFVEIQNKGQFALFEESCENDIVCKEDIKSKVNQLLKNSSSTSLNKFLALFYTEYGVLCKSSKIREVLRNMEEYQLITVTRDPALTETGKKSTFFTEGKGKHVTIMRNK